MRRADDRQTENYVVLAQMPFVADARNVEKPGGHMW